MDCEAIVIVYVGMDDITAENVKELLEAHGQSLSNEYLEKSAKQLDRQQSE